MTLTVGHPIVAQPIQSTEKDLESQSLAPSNIGPSSVYVYRGRSYKHSRASIDDDDKKFRKNCCWILTYIFTLGAALVVTGGTMAGVCTNYKKLGCKDLDIVGMILAVVGCAMVWGSIFGLFCIRPEKPSKEIDKSIK